MSNLKRKDFFGKRVLIVGDVCVDHYMYGVSNRIAQEANVPVVTDFHAENRLGMSANVAENVKFLGAEPVLISVTGLDDTRSTLVKMLNDRDIIVRNLLIDEKRKTTKKTRIYSNGIPLARLDEETSSFIDSKLEEQLISAVQEEIAKCDVVIIQDYGKGMLSKRVISSVIGMAWLEDKKVFVDPHKNTPLTWYKGAHAICPNLDECRSLSGRSTPEKGACEIYKKANIQKVFVTCGENGIFVYDSDFSQIVRVEKVEKVVDVTGAGDTVVAVLALASTKKMYSIEAAALANKAARIVIQKQGTSVCTLDELLD